MKKSLIYIIGLLFVSSLFISGAVADDVAPLIRPLTTEIKMVSSSGYGISSEPAVAKDAAIYPYGNTGPLVVKPSYSNIRLQPGESKEVKVTVSNRGDETASIDPTLVIQPYSENYLKDEWVTVTPQTFELAPDAKQEFVVKISIPRDADVGFYSASMVFGEFDAQNYTPSYPVYGGSLEMSIDVWTPPSVRIETTYINDRVEAGNSYDYQVNVTNVGKQDIAMDPEVLMNTIYYAEAVSSIRYDAGESNVVLDESAVTVDAPSVIRAGETATVKVHLEVPEGATGSFSGTLDLGINDPALREWEGQVQLYFTVWEQPSEPFVEKFTTSADGIMRIEISTSVYDYGLYGSSTSGSLSPSFEVSMKQGNRQVEMQLVSSTKKGQVTYGSGTVRPLMASDSFGYQNTGKIYTEVYEVSGPAGEWTLSILPVNTDNFEYSITTGDLE